MASVKVVYIYLQAPQVLLAIGTLPHKLIYIYIEIYIVLLKVLLPMFDVVNQGLMRI